MIGNWEIPLDIVADCMKIKGDGGVFEELTVDAPVLLLYGTAGSGNTSWAANHGIGGIGYQYITTVELIDRMVACKHAHEVKALEFNAKTAPRLIIEEVGLEGNIKFSPFGSSFSSEDIIRRILMARLVCDKITILTTNMYPEAMFAK